MPIQNMKIKNYFISQYFLINFSWLIITFSFATSIFILFSLFIPLHLYDQLLCSYFLNFFLISFFFSFYKIFQKKTIYLPLNFMIGFIVGCNKQWNHALKSEYIIYILIFLAKTFIFQLLILRWF